eukprot:3937990-Rhodomonas_salina.2
MAYRCSPHAPRRANAFVANLLICNASQGAFALSIQPSKPPSPPKLHPPPFTLDARPWTLTM